MRTLAPGPRGMFPLGCLAAFRRDPLGFLLQASRNYGDVVRLRFGPVVAHLVNHPDYAAHVLQHHWRNYDKDTRSVAKIRATCGDSLLSTDGELWRRHRRLIQPAFQLQTLDQHVPVVASATAEMLDRWEEPARAGRSVNIVSEMARVTLNIAARILFGSDVSGETDAIERSLTIILNDTWRRVESLFDATAFSSMFHRREFREAVKAIDAVVYRLIESRRRSGTATPDLLSILIRARDDENAPLSDRELRDATITLLLAGHETTANALAWAMHLVSEFRNVDGKLRHESRSVLGNRPPVPGDLDRLEYAAMVFSETIRLYPSIWILERRVVVDDEIAGYRIPAGSMLLISPYVLHRNPEFWPEPERFEPERFSRDGVLDRPQNAFLPFGLGPHQCIGRFMAQMVAQVILAMVAQRFRLRRATDAAPAPLPGITLRHANALWMSLERPE
ncbi:MAG: cytochrome P450 [Planctomycetaceae bacterium]